MKLEVVSPEKFMGDVTGMINSKRGTIEAMGERGQARVITAKVPLSELFGLHHTAALPDRRSRSAEPRIQPLRDVIIRPMRN